MTVLDDQVAFMRAYLLGDEDAVARDWGAISASPSLAALTDAAFVIATRRAFAPTWTTQRVIQYVAEVRAALSGKTGVLDPRIAERELRRALGDDVSPTPSDPAAAATQLILLASLAVTLHLNAADIDDLLNQARRSADQVSRL
jgi:hypothetical protein